MWFCQQLQRRHTESFESGRSEKTSLKKWHWHGLEG